MSHLKDKHQDWEQIYNEFKKNNLKAKKAPAGSVFFINPKVITLHSWLDWIVTENLPISAVEKRSFREYSNLESISVDTFEKYLKLVEAGIEKNLKTELPTNFGLIIDGWTEGSTHYFGVFASYRKNGTNYTRFLTISPPLDETSFTAQKQADFLVDVVEALGRCKENILYLVADNTATNPATATALDVPFIGCASHRFNLAVQKYLERHQRIISDINHLMISLTNLKRAGRLRQFTDLQPIVMNTTRWSSKHVMLERFFRLDGFIKEMRDHELDQLIPSGRDLANLKELGAQMQDFEIVTKKLQDPSISLQDVRLIFDEVISVYPSMKNQLAKDADIVKHPSFESGICKVLSKEESILNNDEMVLLKRFEIAAVDSIAAENETLIERAMKRKRTDGDSKYSDLTCIPPTSNVCERSFSAARYFPT